jgi:hypothetical protein
VAFIKNKFRNGTVLKAIHMNNIEDALADLEKSKNQSGTIVPANYEINSTLVQDYI